ncbi:Uncharacterised protein [Mycoplasma putrefaciens]|nr:Uncharacterised protein [Mycoplasma putrefaciens]
MHVPTTEAVMLVFELKLTPTKKLIIPAPISPIPNNQRFDLVSESGEVKNLDNP